MNKIIKQTCLGYSADGRTSYWQDDWQDGTSTYMECIAVENADGTIGTLRNSVDELPLVARPA
jgi:hypothetical protein